MCPMTNVSVVCSPYQSGCQWNCTVCPMTRQGAHSFDHDSEKKTKPLNRKPQLDGKSHSSMVLHPILTHSKTFFHHFFKNKPTKKKHPFTFSLMSIVSLVWLVNPTCMFLVLKSMELTGVPREYSHKLGQTYKLYRKLGVKPATFLPRVNLCQFMTSDFILCDNCNGWLSC